LEQVHPGAQRGLRLCPLGRKINGMGRLSDTEVDGTLASALAVANGVLEDAPRLGEDLRTGDALAGRYQILRRLGTGGMGAVYAALDLELDETIALKLLRSELASSAGVLERFRREVKLARRVTHPNVARTYELGEHAGVRFLTMEYVDGESLASLLRQRGRMEESRAVAIALPICAALQAAHQAGVVHRDIKPDNVMVARDGRVVLTDFGIARGGLDQAERTLVGTPRYMAPEQVSGGALTARTDLYSLGATLYEMLSGEPPFDGPTLTDLLIARLQAAPPDVRERVPGLSPALALVVRRAMEPEPEARFASAAELADALRAAVREVRGASALRDRAPPLLGDPAATRRSLIVLGFSSGGSPSEAALAGSLAEGISDALAMLRTVRMLSHRSARAHAGADPAEAGRTLGADLVLDGSLRAAGEACRLTLRLLSTANREQLWTRRFERPLSAALELEDEAVAAVSAAVGSAGGLGVAPPPRAARTTDPTARDLGVRARQAYLAFNVDNAIASVELFEEAHRLAPEDPVIASGFALALLRGSFVFGPGAGADVMARANMLAEQAVDRAPELGEPHHALAQVYLHLGDVPEATRELRRAIACAPHFADAHASLGSILLEIGRVEDGVRRVEAAVGLDPALEVARWEVSRAIRLLGQTARADAILSDAVHRKVSVGLLLRLRFATWARDQAALEEVRKDAEQALLNQKTPAAGTRLFLPFIDAVLGGSLEPVMVELDFRSSPNIPSTRVRAVGHQLRAELHGARGEDALCVAAVRASADLGLFDLLWLDHCPILATARSDPEWAALREVVAARADACIDAMWG
jgi:serine/threonine-protein kinase